MPFRRTWVEIDRSALRANFRTFSSILPQTVKIAPVIKANAYGHGMQEVLNTLQNEPIWGFCVALGEEALEIKSKTKERILVMSAWQPRELPDLLKNNIHLVVWDLTSAKVVNRCALRIGKRANVHVKIDSGAGRIGLRPESTVDFATALPRLSGIRCVGVFSHFANSEENGTHFTTNQLRKFRATGEIFGPHVERHIACTAASLRYPKSWFSFIRLGLGLYGLWPTATMERKTKKHWPQFKLRPVLQWITTLLQIKDVPAGTSVSYGHTFQTKRRTRLGVLPIGYWDGYDRSFGNHASVLIQGQRAPILGRVCMNLTMVDVTNIRQAKVGERVTLIGNQGRHVVTADALALIAKTINYEIVTRINPRLPRIVV